MNFAELHHQNNPLLIANVWDAVSALAAQQAGYQAIGTSSAAMAAMLGYDDGEALSFDELLYIVKRIRAVSHLPLSVDMEAGYGERAIVERLNQLAALGVAGINLEDSRVVNGVRQLDDASGFAARVKAISDALRAAGCPLFLNIRTDTYLLNHPQALQETLLRGQLYQAAGADGFFVPCLTTEQDIADIARTITIPLNVMCMPELPDFGRLQTLGVRRISMGNFVHSAMQSRLQEMMVAIRDQRAFTGVIFDERAR